jgi:hypothetical protein
MSHEIIVVEEPVGSLLLEQAAAPSIVIQSPGPQGAKGDNGGVVAFEQTFSAATQWTVNHNLGYRPHVAVLSTGGVEVVAEIVHVSINQLIVYFATAFAGSVRCQ